MALHCIAALVAFSAVSASAHGFVQGIVIDHTWYPGYDFMFQYRETEPIVVGWSTPDDISTGYINPLTYTSPDVICHWNATPAAISAPVQAGGVVELQWTQWPEGHHGPVIDYMAKCPGDCSLADKSELKFFKIGHAGLLNTSSQPPGVWATDKLISNNDSWSVAIPEDIAPGNYVLRHEIIALHFANERDGAQDYPQCINLEVISQGQSEPAGVLGTELYNSKDPGISINIYTTLTTYHIPGPSLYPNAISASQTVPSIDAYASVGFSSSPSSVRISTKAPLRPSGANAPTAAQTLVTMSTSEIAPSILQPVAEESSSTTIITQKPVISTIAESSSDGVILVTEYVTATRSFCIGDKQADLMMP